ncbi:MAG: hypothetical protein AAF485_18250, partial [Chloroflexota bacterium]
LLVAWGSDAIPPLQRLEQRSPGEGLGLEAAWLLESICFETTQRLADQMDHLVCTRCFVHCYPHEIDISSDIKDTYYGCRACGQSRTFETNRNGIVAVLDQAMSETAFEQNSLLRVNWLVHQQLFDFDWVEIVQASDEEVERFAVRVGNDTDLIRTERYKEQVCLVAPTAQVSDNSLKVLKQVFKQVDPL